MSFRKGAKQYLEKIITLLILFFINGQSFAKLLVPNQKGSLDQINLPSKIKKSIINGSIYSRVLVKELNKTSKEIAPQQSFDYQISGLHTKNCQVALSRLSQYERYQEWVGLITESRYNQHKKEVYFKLEHSLLPFTMILNFKIPRMKKVGLYSFGFNHGFLKGLKGQFHISQYKSRCFFYTTSFWQGAHTGINSTILSFFSKSLGVMAMEILFRISRTY